MTSHDLKYLQSRLTEAESEIASLKERRAAIDRDLTAKGSQAADLRKRIAELQDGAKDIVISEHAMLRYIERVIGLDLKQLQAIIIPDDLREKIRTLGSGEYSHENPNGKYKLRVKNNTVVTVLVEGAS